MGELGGAEPDVSTQSVREGHGELLHRHSFEYRRQVLVDLLIEQSDAVRGHPGDFDGAVMQVGVPFVEGGGIEMVN